MMLMARAVFAICLFAGSGLLLSSNSWATPNPKEFQRLSDWLTWKSSAETWLKLGGWLTADLVAFPRTEKEHGQSWHITPALSSARINAIFCWQDTLSGRFDLELAETNPDVQEAWFEYHPWELLRFRIGRFRIPFGLAPQNNTPDLRLFATPMFFGNVKDFRDVGLKIWGNWSRGYFGYALAVISGSRDIRIDVNEKPDFAARVFFHLPDNSSAWLSGLHLGVSAGWGGGPERHGFRGRTIGGHTFFNPPAIRGVQWRAGAELEYATPWFRLAGEYTYTTQYREGITTNAMVGNIPKNVGDLSALVISGYYIEASLHIFGRTSKQFLPISGLELCGRFESLSYGDGELLVDTSAGTENKAPLADESVLGIMVGINYYFWPGIRLSAMWQLLHFSNAKMAPDSDEKTTGTAWTHHLFVRAQLLL